MTRKSDLAHYAGIAYLFGWQDVKQTYRRSAIGPFWITLSVSIQILCIGLVFGLLFRLSISDYLPYLATGIIFWSFLSLAISDGTQAFISSEQIIRQVDIPPYFFILRSLWKNVIILGHNLVIIPVVLLVFGVFPGGHLLLFIPGFLLVAIFLFFATFLVAVATTRFRDIQQIVTAIIGVLFYITPVIWKPELIPPGIAHILLGLNPMYHLLQITRLPLMGQSPTFENWLVACVAVSMAGILAVLVAKKYNKRLVYWV
jgi:lipopolysaccharide transport system permease protein